MKDIKIAFFDIDWTLFDHKAHKWVESSLEAIKKLQSSGVKCFICTARSYSSCKLFGVYDLGIKWDGGVYSAGSVGMADRKIVYNEAISPKDVKRFLNIMEKHHCVTELVGIKKTSFTHKPNFYVKEYRKDYRDRDPLARKYDGKIVTCFLAIGPEEIDKDIREAFPNMYLFRYHKYALDCKGWAYTKGDGVSKILNYYGYSKDQAIGFGDDVQDIPVAKALNNFVAVGNAKDAVKKEAAFVCEPIDCEGIARFLKEKKLI